MNSSETHSFTQTGSISDELDRLEVLAGKIGMNAPDRAFELLYGLDRVHTQISELYENSASRKVAETQFSVILSRLEAEGRQFIRDLGGLQALRQAREQVRPSPERTWWFVDETIMNKSRLGLRRMLINGGVFAAILAVLVILYRIFLAPDPQVAALYSQEQRARDRLQAGEYDEALVAIDAGLQIDPTEPTFLTLRGIILEDVGNVKQAAQDFAAAEKVFASREAFLVTRGQGYAMINQLEKASVDAQAAINAAPQSARAYLLLGQVHETQGFYQEAMEDYDRAFEIANQNDQIELAAIARTRTAMLMQMINMPFGATQSPEP